ncbi:MAG: hypothetical protein IPP96_03905 [Chitinophagaceae bacterium]|nr:hypothetical protein [Chitinophagaceae bacterium]
MNLFFRKISAVGLVLLIAMPLVFTIGILVKQKIIQFHRRERLETEQLQTITVAAENIRWVKKGKEILVAGKLFDIKHFEKKNSQVTLTGFFDKEEEDLFDQLNKMAKDKNRPSPLTTVISFLLTPYYNEPVSGYCQINWQPHSKEYFSYAEKIPSFPVSDITHPPAA